MSVGDSAAEEGEIVGHGVVGAEGAEGGGELVDGASVVLSTRQESEAAGNISYMDIQRDEKLRRLQSRPTSDVDNAVVAHKPAQGHIETLQGRGIGLRRQETVGPVERVAATAVGLGDIAREGGGQSPCRRFRVRCAGSAGEVLHRAVAGVEAAQAVENI